MLSKARFIMLSVLLGIGTAGCGFHLRGAVDLPERAKAVYLEGIDRGQPFGQEFSELLSFAGGRVTSQRAEATSVVHVIRAVQERRQLSLSKAGKANAFNLLYRIEYEITTPKGEVLMPRQELEISREYFNDQRFPLGQGEQEGLMRAEMEREAAQTLLRRVRYAVKSASASKT